MARTSIYIVWVGYAHICIPSSTRSIFSRHLYEQPHFWTLGVSIPGFFLLLSHPIFFLLLLLFLLACLMRVCLIDQGESGCSDRPRGERLFWAWMIRRGLCGAS
ncbi:hypothetical protein BD289DRAFT_284768 [Coniella lustricola]|uniref:Uncharacterized protein n=1 Tax=Coniella lustricola TaxID=2025994 RepID=A0A2T3AKA7_9PEZI|nr:hypothetical protein BD289DRAFT_284768 [Coniella lustricola]